MMSSIGEELEQDIEIQRAQEEKAGWFYAVSR